MERATRVAGWTLAALALALLLIAPNANGLLLVLIWSGALAAYRGLASVIVGRLPRLVIGFVFLWACFLGAFWGGWFLIPAAIAFLVHDFSHRSLSHDVC